MVLKFIDSLMTGKVKQSRLYDQADKIPVKVFYQVMNTQNLSLLNPQNEKVKKEKLEEIWNNLIDEYYKKSNIKSYNHFFRETKQREGLRNKVITLNAVYIILSRSTNEDKILICKNILTNDFGILNHDLKFLKSLILREKSRLKLLDKKQKKENNKEEINFWKLVSQVEQSLGYQLDIEKVTLLRWIEIIATLKEKALNLKSHGRRQNK